MLSFKKSKKIHFNFKNLFCFCFCFLRIAIIADYLLVKGKEIRKKFWSFVGWCRYLNFGQMSFKVSNLKFSQDESVELLQKFGKEIFRQIKQDSFWPSRNLISLNILFNNAVLYSILDPNRMNWSFIEDHIEESSLFRIVESY